METFNRRPWQLFKRVMPQHTDQAGVMWHGTYIAWLEESRVEALSQVGLPYSDLSQDGYEMPVTSLEINYFSPLVHGEEVLLESCLLPRKGVRWPWQARFLRVSDGSCVSEASVNLVLVARGGDEFRVVRRTPRRIQQALERLHLGPVVS